MTGTHLHLAHEWIVGDRIGGGGFGEVYAATNGDEEAAIKFVPKAPGADRELLFVGLAGFRNVVPIIDSGETPDSWILVMPRAQKSLRDHLAASGGHLEPSDAVAVMKDVCDALVDLNGKVVHRDLKPENVLLLSGHWCLADFGISRYAEATTAPDTQKYALTPPYAAPERWRAERATSGTDIYALGIMALEMLTGEVPFRGPAIEDFREQHLGMSPPPAPEIMTAVATLIEECLFKAPSARPSAANVRARLERVAVVAPSPGLARLQQANQAAVRQEGESSRLESEAQTEKERRDDLYAAGERALERIAAELQAALLQAAPAIRQDATTPPWQRDMEFTLRLGAAELKLVRPRRHARGDWDGRPAPAFDVVGYSSLSLLTAPNQYGYAGRSHSLWFADAVKPNEFLWYETGFMFLPLMAGRDDRQIPFSLSPGEDAAFALAAGLARIQVAWPFTPVVSGALDEFIERWATWFADASEGHLSRPSPMPERPTEGSWRK